MSVIGYGRNYRAEYLKLVFNGMGQVRTLIFDNNEIRKDVEFSERHYPEIYNSAGGFASKGASLQPLRMRVTFRVEKPQTVGKLNDIIAFTKYPYKLTAYLNGFGEWPAFSPYWVDGQFNMRCVVEYDKDLFYRKIARGEGFVRDEDLQMTFHEAQDLVLPEKRDNTTTNVIVVLGDGRTESVAIKNVSDISSTKSNAKS